MVTSALICPTFIGRRRELAALAEYRRAAAGGHGALVLVAGDAGIGKTRVLRAFRETLTNGRASVGAGGYGEFANSPYAAINEALRGVGVRQTLTTERSRAEQFAALQQHVAAACDRRNTVLFLEDLHWADEASFAFLLHLLRSLATMRLLVIATYRSDELHRSHSATPYIARLRRDALTRIVELEPLAKPEMRRFVQTTLEGRLQLPSRELDDIVERSDGNPFFAEELLKSVLEHRDGHAQPRPLPLTIRAAVAERFSLLTPPAATIISSAAIVGRRFEAGFIAEIAGRPLSVVFDALRHARDLQLIDELPANPVRYVFRHELTREAIYSELLLDEVRTLHREIVAALERQAAPEHTADLAYHAWAARDEEKALHYNERAGDEAEALHAYADAARSYERALDFVARDDVRGRLLEKSARSSAHDGNAPRAARLAQAAIEAYRRAGSHERIAELCYLVASELHVAGETDRAMTFLREGLLTLPWDVRPVDRARLALPLAFILLDRASLAEAEALIDESSAAADDAEFAPMYWNTRMYLASLRPDLAATRHAARCFHAAASSDVERHLRARVNIGVNLSLLGDDDASDEQFRAIERELGNRPLGARDVLVGGYSAVHHLRAGRLEHARAVVERLLAMAEPWLIARASVAVAALMVGRALCDDDLVLRASGSDLLEAAFATRIGSTIGRIAGPHARRLHDRGQHQEAASVLRRAVDTIAGPHGATETLLAAAEFGDAQLRGDALAVIEPFAATIPLYTATAAHMRAQAASHAGDDNGTRRFATEAQRAYAELGWSYHRTLCVELGGERDVAAKAFRAMGAIFDVRRLELGAVDRGASRESAGLSEREWRVAELIAAGTPNRVVAERLALSEKTVEKHLTAIYRKLGFRNRSELTAFVVRKET